MLICLIGRHGTGKSTLGQALAKRGFRHINVGELKRRCRKNDFPEGYPLQLLGMLSVQKPGTLLSKTSAKALMAFVQTAHNCVMDGFPPSKDYLNLLPPDTLFLYCMTPKYLREKRLNERFEKTLRRWTPGKHSARDAALAALVRAVRHRYPFCLVVNDEKPIDDVLRRIALPGIRASDRPMAQSAHHQDVLPQTVRRLRP
jgi:adenylate kinase family enzyme